MKKVKLLVADDHSMVREGLGLILRNRPDFEVVAEASDGSEALSLYRQHNPDVAILDLKMPILDGIEATAAIISMKPAAKILLLSTYSREEDIFRGVQAGAKGYLLKDVPIEELVEAINKIHDGGSYLSSGVTRTLAQRNSKEALTPREVEVLRGVSGGQSNKEIASLLGLAEGTVKSHVSSIVGKLQVKSRTEAALVARDRGILW